MKLRRCYIGRYGVLWRLKVDFSTSITDDNLALDFLVGPNGCGKSTLLQALAEIFSKLEVSVEAVRFPFMVEYEIWRNNTAQIYQITNCEMEGDTLPDGAPGTPNIRRKIGDDAWETIPKWSNELLPKTIAILTTGSEEGWQQLLTVSDQGS